MPKFEDLKAEYIKLYADCKPSPANVDSISKAVAKLYNNKKRYVDVTTNTTVPWYFVAIIHMMESGCDFTTHLHNGDSLRTRTVHVPPGRPTTGTPPFTWEFSAKDALQYEGFLDAKQIWDLPDILYKFEKYNGFGYRNPKVNIPSPYLWSMSNIYKGGKFLEELGADGKYHGVFHPEAVSKQCGAAVMLKQLENLKLITIG